MKAKALLAFILNRQKYLFIVFLLLCFNSGFAQDAEYPYAADIRQFRENDKLNPPPQHAILFIGYWFCKCLGRHAG